MEAHLSADKKVEQLSEEELHCVLKQLTDHKTPESEKCPLVQRLNAENAANDTSFSSLHQSAGSVRNDSNRSTAKLLSRMNVLSKDNEFQSSHRRNAPHSHCQDDKMNYAQSLQQPEELNTANYCDDVSLKMNSAGGSCGGATNTSNRKPNRANSFTMPFQSDNSDNTNTTNSTSNILDRQHHLTNGGVVSPDTINNHDHVHFDSNIAKSSLSSSTQPSAPLVSTSALASLSPTNSSHYSNGDKSGDQPTSDNNFSSLNFSSVHLCSISSLVDSINSDNAPNYQQILSDNKGLAGPSSRSLTVEEEEEEKIEFVEMKNLQRKANIIEYRSDMNLEFKQKENDSNNKHCIDKVIDMPLISGNKPADLYAHKHPDYIPNGTSHPTNLSSNGYNSRCSSGNINGSTPVPTNSTNNNNNRAREKKKKRTQAEVKLAEEIEGHIGYRDVSYLESFVNNTSTNLTNGFDKKNNKCKNQKPDNETVKRAPKNNDKRNNGETKLPNDKGTNANKLSSSASNSSSLSGDDIATKTNTSPDPSNKVASKNCKPKRKQAKNNSNQNGKVITNGNDINFMSDNNGRHSEQTDYEKCNQNSSSDDFDGTDAEYDDDEERQGISFYCRSQKSNSLLQSGPVHLNDDEKNFYTVSDSEMADREKGFVTPKSKYFKKKRNQQSKRQRDNVFNSNKLNHQNVAANGEEVNHSLGRGYESERECSVSNANCMFTSQTFSSSMFTINPKISDTAQCNNQYGTLNPSADSNFLSNSDNDLTLCMATDNSQNSGPKIPSYADIAKSYNISPPILSKALGPIKSSEDFPQLNSVPQSEVIDAPTDSSKINFPINTDALNDETVADCQDDKDHKMETKSKNKSNKKEAQCNSISSQSVKNDVSPSVIEMNPSNAVNSELSALAFLDNGHVDILDVNNRINNGSYSPPVVIFGDNSLDICLSAFGDEAPFFESDESLVANGASRGKLVFGFFDDIDSEIFMLKQNGDDCSEVNFTKDVELGNASSNNDGDESNLCENVPMEENFFKNAVHVNDLEEGYFRKLNTGTSASQDTTASTLESISQSNQKYSSTSSSTLSSSFDSSLTSTSSSATVSSSSIQSTPTNLSSPNQLAPNEPRPFISCASKIKNMKFIDNVDENSFNYVSIVGYVYKAWNIWASL